MLITKKIVADITVSPAAITIPTTLAHIGTAIPRTVTSQLKDTLRICTNAINANMTAAILVNQRFKNEIFAMLGKRVERLRQRLRQRASQSG